MNFFEMRHYYDQYRSAYIKTQNSRMRFEDMKNLYDRGIVGEEAVRAAEDEYLAAKAESDRLWELSEYGPQPDPDARWQPRMRIADPFNE